MEDKFTDSSLGSLYQEVIVDHARSPRCKGRPKECCSFCQEGKNPLCGDQITLFCRVDDKNRALPKISVHFEGSGCSISQASASMMCSTMQNVSVAEAREILKRAEGIYSGHIKSSEEDFCDDIEALGGVSRFPARVKCAALPWKSLQIMLNERFDGGGVLKAECPCEKAAGCTLARKLKVVSTEAVLPN